MGDQQRFPTMYVPAVSFYTPLIVEFVRTMGALVETPETCRNDMVEAVRHVVLYIDEQSKSEGEVVLEPNHTPGEFAITIRNVGPPIDPLRSTSPEGRASTTARAHWMEAQAHVDVVQFINKGKEGQEIRLRKGHDHCGLDWKDPATAVTECDLPDTYDGSIAIRLFCPTDAVDVARCAFDAYGYSYVYEDIYNPAKFEALNAAGTICSIIAADDDGAVAGHAALVLPEDLAGLGDLSMLMTMRRYRGHHIATRLGQRVVEEAEQKGLQGIFIESVTSHGFTQKLSHQLGFVDSAILLAYAPSQLSFRGIEEEHPTRETVVLAYRQVAAPQETAPLHIHPAHREMVQAIYETMGLERTFETSREWEPEGKSNLHTTISRELGIAKIIIDAIGRDCLEIFAEQVRNIVKHDIPVVICYINAQEQGATWLAEECETHGFFFSGVLPGSDAGDYVIMQKLHVAIPPKEKIVVADDFTQSLLDYVIAHAPDTY